MSAYRLLTAFTFAAVAAWNSISAAAPPAFFQTAKPVWPEGREKEMNLSVGFRAVVDLAEGVQKKTVLRVAAATIYRAWVNGEFAGYGPARGPHGYYRVDEWDVTDKLHRGKNLVAIEVAGYNVNSYYLLDQPSFLQAEITSGDHVLAATAGGGTALAATVLDYRVQKVQRYSFQRPFIEAYCLAPGWDRWLRACEKMGTGTSPWRDSRGSAHRAAEPVPIFSQALREPSATLAVATVAIQPEKRLLPRRVPYPAFERILPSRLIASGVVEKVAARGRYGKTARW